jgi:hypothetical protein
VISFSPLWTLGRYPFPTKETGGLLLWPGLVDPRTCLVVSRVDVDSFQTPFVLGTRFEIGGMGIEESSRTSIQDDRAADTLPALLDYDYGSGIAEIPMVCERENQPTTIASVPLRRLKTKSRVESEE